MGDGTIGAHLALRQEVLVRPAVLEQRPERVDPEPVAGAQGGARGDARVEGHVDAEAVLQELPGHLEVGAPIVGHGHGVVDALERRGRAHKAQAGVVGEQRQDVLDVIAAAQGVLHELVRETLRYGSVAAVLLVLRGLLVVREADDLVPPREHDVAGAHQQGGHVAPAVLHRDELDALGERVRIRILRDGVDLLRRAGDEEVDALGQDGERVERDVEHVEVLHLKDECRARGLSPSRIQSIGR